MCASAGEELAAESIATHGYPKPVVAYIAGRHTPEGKKMGHAGAIINGNLGAAESKISSLGSAGVQGADRLEDILTLLGSRKRIGARRPVRPSSTWRWGVRILIHRPISKQRQLKR